MLTSISATSMPIALTGGVVYLLMAATMWRMLRHTPQARVVRLWTWGAVCLGACLVLVASRDVVNLLVGYGLPAVLASAGFCLQTAALRAQLGLSGLWRLLRWPATLLLGPILVLVVLDQRAWLFVVCICALAGQSAMLAWHAQRMATEERSRSAALIAWSQWAFAALMLLRALAVALGLSGHQHTQGGLTFVVLHAAAVLTALYGSLGFMGLMLDLARRAEVLAREREVAEAARREAAEQAAQALRGLLAQRDALSAEREQLLQLLAHEIRQPLHNASGALRAAGQMLKSPQPLALDQVAQGLSRAEKVLEPVRSVLDNTLAVATVLARKAPLAMQQVDLSFLVELAMGDLDEAQRGRLEVAWHTDLRELDMEPGLLRLALRNLLVNAFHHGGPRVQVVLDIDEEPDASAVVLKVQDNGPGMAPAALATALGIGDKAAGRASLGLLVVRQVAALHGGSLTLANRPGGGLQAWLRLPLPGVQ